MSKQNANLRLIVPFLAFILFTANLNAQEARTWSSANGKFKIEAKYVGADGTNVVLKKADGTEIKVPLSKLSPRDQGVVEGLMAAAGDGNPFEVMSDEGATDSGASESSGDGEIKMISVDFTLCDETKIEMGKWQPNIGEQPQLPFEVKNIILPGKADFHERLVKVATNIVAKRTVLTYHVGRSRKSITTRLTLVDLESGEIVGNASGEGKWEALSVHDDGERIVVQNISDSEETQGQLGTVRLSRKKMVPIDLWTPYAVMKEPGKEKIVRFCKFINDGMLLTLSQNGRVVIWDFEQRKAKRRFNYHGACEPSLSQDRKHLAICGGDKVGFVNLEDKNDAPSVKQAPLMNYWLKSSFSPSYKRFAAATMQKLMVWDVESGDVLFEGSIPGLSTNGNVHFPHEDYVIVNGDKLVEFASGIKVWRYHGASLTRIGAQSAFVVEGDNEGKIIPVELPHKEALTWLDRAKGESDLFVLKKGAKVGLDLSGVPGQYRGDVEQSLKKQIEKKGFEFATSAPVTFKAEISGPTQEAVSYQFAGSYVVNQYLSKLNVMYAGKSIWGSSRNNVPGSVSRSSKEEIKAELAKAGRSPNIGFYSSVNLPDFLQKPSEGDNSSDAQMLGQTKVGLNGLEE